MSTSPYAMVELIGGKYGGQFVAVYPDHDGQLPRRIHIGEFPYVRFGATKVYFPDNEGEEQDAKPKPPPITLPLVRRPRALA